MRAKPNKTSWLDFASGRAHAIAVLLVLIASLRIAGTWREFNHVVDEPFHIAMGMEWLSQGNYQTENQHPPLARVLGAIGPYLDGAQLRGDKNLYNEGMVVLYGGMNYETRLAFARLGVLPLFWIACWALYAWCARWLDRVTALIALLLFTSLPGILAHAGLATTDMALVAGMGAALWSLLRWIEEPGWKHAALAGFCWGFALLTKFSALVFLPASLAAALVFYIAKERMIRWPRIAPLEVLAAAGVCALVVWGGYRFHIGKPIGWNFAIPAPELVDGIEMVRKHNADGHMSWLLGQFSKQGFWYFYPVALFFKTPLGFLALAVAGLWAAVKEKEWRYWLPAACFAGILGFALTSRINIGTRHVLPVYFFLSIAAAVAARKWMGRVVVVLIAWAVLSPAASHPDYLAYFNLFAGGEPERILVDSDLDWGQDMKRLGVKLREARAQQVAMNPLNFGFWEEVHGFPPIVPLDPAGPKRGWNAVSVTMLNLTRMGTREKDPHAQLWTDRTKPTARVGGGILLYYNPGN